MLLEPKPDDAVGRAAIGDRSSEQLERAALVAFVGRDGFEELREPLIRELARRRLIHVGAFERAQPIVDAAVDVHDFGVLFQQRDRRQEALALQAAGVELVGHDVRRCGERHAAREQAGEHVAEQHRVGDVGDGELVEANDARALRDLLGDEVERVLDVAMLLQAARARPP